jgi:hypothetical protein
MAVDYNKALRKAKIANARPPVRTSKRFPRKILLGTLLPIQIFDERFFHSQAAKAYSNVISSNQSLT